MKKSSLTTAVLAGLAGVVGFAGSAGAVDINPDGTGQALIYPYYTTRAGNDTIISVVNSTDTGKAVKVRFLEGYNSREVRDFNLFLSPYDVWVATIFDLEAHGAGTGAGVDTKDKSCTVPNKSGWTADGAGGFYVGFSNQEFAGAKSDTGPTDMDRTREGYVELINMADVTGTTLAAITHKQVPGPNGDTPNAGAPTGCAAIPRFDDPTYVDPTGGLFGSGQIVNVAEGTLYPYNADAIDGFMTTKFFTESGSLLPSLASADTSALSGPGTARAFVFAGSSGVVQATYGAGSGQAVDAVSAVFAASALLNEWAADAAGGIGTDWVVTFPTKRFYVDPAYVTSALPPFVEVFGENNDGQSCTQVGLNKFDREEGEPYSTPDDPFSPAPPGQPPSSLCHEVNVISISAPSAPISILGSTYGGLALNTSNFGANGWMRLDLNPAPGSEPHMMVPSQEGVVFGGLPATGFAATRYINANAQPGMLANYAGAFHHRVERDISTQTVP